MCIVRRDGMEGVARGVGGKGRGMDCWPGRARRGLGT